MLPPGQLGWRLARKLVDEAGPLAEVAASVTQGQPGRAVRRRRRPRRRPAAARHRHRPLRRPHRQGELLPARTQAPARRLDPAARAVRRQDPAARGRAGAIGRGGRDDPVARTAFASVDGADALLTRPGRDLRRRHARADPAAAEDRRGLGQVGRQPAQRPVPGREAVVARTASASRTRTRRTSASGVATPRCRCCSSRSRCPARTTPGQTTRLGALACRLWVPILERSR